MYNYETIDLGSWYLAVNLANAIDGVDIDGLSKIDHSITG